MADPIRYHEPAQLTAGDTISFTRVLGDYLASDGWSLVYELRGQGQVIEFASTANGDSHVLLVAAATTAAWLPGDYQFSGYAVNVDGERHQIYLADLVLGQNLQGAAGDVLTSTHAQRMLALIETVLEGKATHDILDSMVEGTTIRRIPPNDLLKLRSKYRRERQGEIALEAARNGRPTGRRIRPRISIMSPGAARGLTQFGAGGYPCDE